MEERKKQVGQAAAAQKRTELVLGGGEGLAMRVLAEGGSCPAAPRYPPAGARHQACPADCSHLKVCLKVCSCQGAICQQRVLVGSHAWAQRVPRVADPRPADRRMCRQCAGSGGEH